MGEQERGYSHHARFFWRTYSDVLLVILDFMQAARKGPNAQRASVGKSRPLHDAAKAELVYFDRKCLRRSFFLFVCLYELEL